MSITGLQVILILNKIAEVLEKNKLYLSELDAAIGDGDHGINMNKGFNAVVAKLKDDDGLDIGVILKKTGMALVSNVGGAAGPLYGTAFMKAAAAINGKSDIDVKDYIKILEAALSGVMMRGKAQRGEKTMIDALAPAIVAMKKADNAGQTALEILKISKDAAMQGVEYTKTIIATKGRASYLGERSIGHQDAGATSSYLILNTIFEEVKNINESKV
ncbi:dihydroxyacetone kinase subunit L [Clostridium estertheticum]|uniref:dihydroxyacetone kinase subunit DhaL n=1 Tax=Clostridium estertheticum TaxID=238834 RepID=UPI001CF10197|nr:dihydroxyacetone kinase subunit DhaL [Clostridium estertheticum]MCB2305087.1 dihydroxyacetone kinase subunit L [Clostridium estertheticum]MCB2343643.1 dihydroxyacetone kinase subunit L [Clostridium estertheticum]MCB2348562.1 dihydroxyacetone kinase subunit L [Clostridium estertheticum]WAG47506.1 dihydroxyacetone kinase subunit L [Clostridium estertheticum]